MQVSFSLYPVPGCSIALVAQHVTWYTEPYQASYSVCSRILLQKLIRSQLVKKFPLFQKPEDLLSRSQGTAIRPYHERDKHSPRPLIFVFKIHFNIIIFKKNKYMFMAPEQNAGQNHNIKIGNTSFDTLANFKHFETILKIKIDYIYK
jgi:hypothetical protein